MNRDLHALRKKNDEDERYLLRRQAILANSPLAIGEEQAGGEDAKALAGLAEGVAQYAPIVGTLGGTAIGGTLGGAAGAAGGALTGIAGGPVGVGAGALTGGLGGAATGAGVGSQLGGGVGQLVSTAAQGYADQYNNDVDEVRLREEARRQQILNLLGSI